jgi:hypothetical protein
VVDIYRKESCVTDISWGELKYRAYYHVHSLSLEQLKQECPKVLSDYLRITYNPEKDCFEVKGQGYAVATLMGSGIYYEDRYSSEIVGVDWSAVHLNLLQACVPNEVIQQILNDKDIAKAEKLLFQ